MTITPSWDDDDEEIGIVAASHYWTSMNRGRELCGRDACLLLRENLVASVFWFLSNMTGLEMYSRWICGSRHLYAFWA